MVSGKVKKEDFAYIVERLQNKLSNWKSSLLNKAGKLTLAKAVLSAIPVYPMHLFWLPASICESIDAVVRRFIWQNSLSHTRGIHLVKWDTISLARR